ncbi:unnamed protein product [Schistosoma bovis]|nr:unnamed protein product [Schistosoma bovis]
MDNLLQENHSLLKKLELKKEMEAAYLDEIEQLRSVITRLQQEKTSISTPRVDDNSLLLYNLEGRVEKSEEKVALLTKELDLAKKREADLLEQLNSFVNKVDSISECSITVPEPHNSLVEEINRLKEELSSKETSNRLEQSKLTRQIQESENDRQNLQDYIIELDRQLKDCRLELNDTQAQLEALQIQSNSTESTRGNSVFSEIEDRRIRAEQIVIKQGEQINELKLRLRQTETDAKRKLLDQERGALKISKAFNLEGNSQEGVISNLERRIKQYKRAQEQSTEIISGLRQRLLDSGQIRRKLQNELWHSIDENTSLSEQISELRKQLSDLRSGKVSDNLKANNVELKIKQSSPSLTESDKLDVENRDPQKLNSNKAIYCTNPLKETPVELSKPVHRVDRPGAGIQSKDLPQNCNTS